MRSDLIPGAAFFDCALSDQACRHRKFSELTSSMDRQPPLTGISHVFSKCVSMIAALARQELRLSFTPASKPSKILLAFEIASNSKGGQLFGTICRSSIRRSSRTLGAMVKRAYPRARIQTDGLSTFPYQARIPFAHEWPLCAAGHS